MASPTNVLAIARRELGVHESPASSNRQKYGAWYGFDGQPWCAMFVTWVLHQGGIKVYRFAAVAASVAWAKKTARLSPTPQPGYVACRLNTPTTGHTGIVEAVHGDGTVTTIEGNTSPANDRDGGTVMRRRRSRAYWNQGFIRIDFQTNDGGHHVQPGGCSGVGGHSLLKASVQLPPATHFQELANRWLQARGQAPDQLLKVDGEYGPRSEAVARDIQKVYGLEVDGECGPMTWATLHRHVDGLTV